MAAGMQIRTASSSQGEFTKPWHIMIIQPVFFRGVENVNHPTIVPAFPRYRFFPGIQKTIRIYASIRYYELHRVVQQELGNVKGEDLCVY
jgi:hypothetical protein